MKRIISLAIFILEVGLFLPLLALKQVGLQGERTFSHTALMIIDIQNFYFKDGRLPLVGNLEASLQAKKILEEFRSKKMPVVHVRHVPLNVNGSDPTYGIHVNVAPLAQEKVIAKHEVNSFRETDLLDYLKQNKIQQLVICGMQTHMCVEAAVRAAADYGFAVILPHDACATRNLNFGGLEIPAAQVHAAVLATLSGNYARVIKTDELLAEVRPIR